MSHQPSARELIPVAAQKFTALVHGVPKDMWAAQTPCSDWSTRDLVNHVVSEHFWAPHLLGGETVDQVGDRYDGDLLGDDPVSAWDKAITQSLNAFASVEDEQPVNLSFGTVPVDEYANQMLVDLTVHAWDLAGGSHQDERLDEHTVAHALAYVQEHAEDMAGSGLFSEPVEVDSDDPQDQLLALLGRDPRED